MSVVQTAGTGVCQRARYVPTVSFLGRFQCPCDRVSLLSQNIHLRTGNLSVVGGTSVPYMYLGVTCRNLQVRPIVSPLLQLDSGPRPSKVAGLSLVSDSYLVDLASSHMLVSKIKPCMSKYKPH